MGGRTRQEWAAPSHVGHYPPARPICNQSTEPALCFTGLQEPPNSLKMSHFDTFIFPFHIPLRRKAIVSLGRAIVTPITRRNAHFAAAFGAAFSWPRRGSSAKPQHHPNDSGNPAQPSSPHSTARPSRTAFVNPSTFVNPSAWQRRLRKGCWPWRITPQKRGTQWGYF